MGGGGLKPCPLCGTEGKRHTCLGDRVRNGPPWYETRYRVSCSGRCSCSSKPCDTQEDADADWNTRAYEDRITALEAENADARGVLDRIDVIAEVADAAPLSMGEIRMLIKMHRERLEGGN